MADATYRMNRSDRRRLRKRLADVPRALDLTHRVLQVAPRHVEPDSVSIHQFICLLRVDPKAAFADGDDQLDFVLIVLGGRGIIYDADARRNHRYDRIRRPGE